MSSSGVRAQINFARREVESRLKGKVVKTVARNLRKSVVTGMELERERSGAGGSEIVRIAVKIPRPDPGIPTFDPVPDLTGQYAREFQTLQAAHTLAANRPRSLTAIQVPEALFLLDQPHALVMEFVTGNALHDIMIGAYPPGLGLISDHLEEKASALADFLIAFGELRLSLPMISAADETKAADNVLRWLAEPAHQLQLPADLAVVKSRLSMLAGNYRPAAASLRHGDLTGVNLMIDHAGGICLLDFEESTYGDPSVDIARFLLSMWLCGVAHPPARPLADRMASAFAAGWARHRQIDVSAVEFMLGLHIARQTGFQIDALLGLPADRVEAGRARIAACGQWLTGSSETSKWLERVLAAKR